MIKKLKDGNYMVRVSRRFSALKGGARNLTRIRNSKKEPIKSLAEAKRLEKFLERKLIGKYENYCSPLWRELILSLIHI